MVKLKTGLWVDPKDVTAVFAAEGEMSCLDDELIQPRIICRTRSGDSHVIECRTDEEAKTLADQLGELIVAALLRVEL